MNYNVFGGTLNLTQPVLLFSCIIYAYYRMANKQTFKSVQTA